MRPEQVLDCQADLLERLAQPHLNRIWSEQVQADWRDVGADAWDAFGNARTMMKGLETALVLGEGYHVTPDMSLMVEHLAAQLDATDVFLSDLAPAPAGIVFFERPLPVHDVRGKTLLIHWLVWGSMSADLTRRAIKLSAGVSLDMSVAEGYGNTTLIYFFNDHLLGPDEVGVEIARRRKAVQTLGRWGFMGGIFTRSGETVGRAILAPPPGKVESMAEEGVTAQAMTNINRYVHALWTLLGQTVTTLEPVHVRKTSDRFAKRMGIHPRRVTVVRLRHTSGVRHEETNVDWSCRWLVRPHPRWQPYGSRNADHVHRIGRVFAEAGHAVRRCEVAGCDYYEARIVIPLAVKGPEGKPLRLTQHVYDLAR